MLWMKKFGVRLAELFLTFHQPNLQSQIQGGVAAADHGLRPGLAPIWLRLGGV